MPIKSRLKERIQIEESRIPPKWLQKHSKSQPFTLFAFIANFDSQSDNNYLQRSILLQMKVCHVCEKIVKVLRSVTCSTCKKTYCFPCIVKFFPSKTKQYLPETEEQALNKSKTKVCFSCLKQCICDKCKANRSVLAYPKQQAEEQIQYGKLANLIKEEEPITENGFFKGKKYSELPGFMQRAYLKKKIIYSKHELSMPSMVSLANGEDMNAQRPEEIKIEDKKGAQSGGDQRDQSNAGRPQIDCSVSGKNQMEQQNENQNEREENRQEQNQESGGQNENVGSSQQNANEMEDEQEQQSSKKKKAGEREPQDSSKKNQGNSEERKNTQKKLKQALQNVQDQSSIQIVPEEQPK